MLFQAWQGTVRSARVRCGQVLLGVVRRGTEKSVGRAGFCPSQWFFGKAGFGLVRLGVVRLCGVGPGAAWQGAVRAEKSADWAACCSFQWFFGRLSEVLSGVAR